MTFLRRFAQLASIGALPLAVAIASQSAAPALANVVQPAITVSQLAGPWAVSLTGDTGCGITTAYFTVTLNSSGSGTANEVQHTSACGDLTGSAPFAIVSLNANGSGTAHLSCGSGCGWDFNIQVSRNRQEFNLVDVTNPGNYFEGIAIRQ
ncbi:MAG: hypothetical protein JO060_06555 [Candidatus Eremiobacteraeota bacterium]|nr:hypothetical protein [Candidatus Eremiobacteraeota bacterium]MBV9647574.1 hypothetical protein [Candidatus Eremiobacteraeota bacterium]